MTETYWKNMLTEYDINRARNDNGDPPTKSQLNLVKWIARKHNRQIPIEVFQNKRAASCFIDAVNSYGHFLTLDSNTQAHIERIWRGELKHDKGTPENPLPWC